MTHFKFVITGGNEKELMVKHQTVLDNIEDMKERYISYFADAAVKCVTLIGVEFKKNLVSKDGVQSEEVTAIFSDELTDSIKEDFMFNIKQLYKITIN